MTEPRPVHSPNGAPATMAPQPVTVLAVLVLHGRAATDATGWTTLQNWLDASEGDIDRAKASNGRSSHALHLAHILVYDNSAQAQDPGRTRASPRITYLHDPSNGGTAAAYAEGAALARQLGIDWVLLLDHDTALPPRYLSTASAMLARPDVGTAAALVPQVRHGTRDISPARLTRLGAVRPLAPGKRLAPGDVVTAIASGTLIRAAQLAALLPLPPGLWLDYVDHWIFLELHRRGLRIEILPEVLAHDLSVKSVAALSPQRLYSILDGEALLIRHLGIAARLAYPWRLLARAARYLAIKPSLGMRVVGWSFSHLFRGR